jgi:hypothetical protein
VKDLQERKSAGYTKKPKPRVWKQPSVAQLPVAKAASARVPCIWCVECTGCFVAVIVSCCLQAAVGKAKPPVDELLFGDPAPMVGGTGSGGRSGAKGPTWIAAAQGQVTTTDSAFPSLGESVGSRPPGWPATAPKGTSNTIRKSSTVAVSHASGEPW